MTGRKTTQEDVDMVLLLRSQGERHGEIVKRTKLSANVVSRILDGWRPTGRKPVRLTRNVYRRGPAP